MTADLTNRWSGQVYLRCKQFSYGSSTLGRRQIIARFDASAITSDGGGLPIREFESKFGLNRKFAGCLDDFLQAASELTHRFVTVGLA